MSLDLTTITPPAAHPSKPPGSRLVRYGLIALAGSTALVLGAAWQSGYRVQQFWQEPPKALDVVSVGHGEMAVYILETGTVESAANTTIKCQVESLIGNVGGSSATTKGGAASGASGGSYSSTGGSAATSSAATASIKSAASTKKSSGSSSSAKKAGSGGSSGGSAGGGSGGGGGSGSGSGGGGGGSGGGGGGGGGGSMGSSGGSSGSSGSSSGGGSGGKSGTSGSTSTSTAITLKPTIRSFSLTVPAYASLRTATKASPSTGKSKSAGKGAGGNRGGGGGGGGGGMGGGNPDEKPGSTRIIMLKPEGQAVTAGEVVCELDSAAFIDELLAQRIKVDQARSWMIQAGSILEVNEISLAEYRQGIFQQDRQLLRQYLQSCQTEEDRARKNMEWSRAMVDKGYRAPGQHAADSLAYQKAKMTLSEAKLMLERLEKYTGPKLIKSLEAKLEANRADTLAQKSAYQIETDRLKRLERMVANCTLRAPRDGNVVYALPPSNGWRPATPSIMEGATVREGQNIIELPDAKHMRVRAKVNETKVRLIQPGQKVSLRVDAFPDKVVSGTVTEVTVIPSLASGPGSDVKVYFANITIDSGGFEGLRPGLSAEVTILLEDREAAMRLPVNAIRWADGVPYAALSTSPDRSAYRWQELKIGLMNADYAEILSGLKLGDNVVANAQYLPRPTPAPFLQASGTAPGGSKF